MEQEDQFLYDDDALADVIKKFEKKKGRDVNIEDAQQKDGHREVARELELVEFFEAEEVEEAIEKIEKTGLDIEDYHYSAMDKTKKAKDGKETEPKNTLYKIEQKDEPDVHLENLAEALRYVQAQGKKGLSIQRYKGLGEMNPEQLWETTMDPARRTVLKVELEDMVEADKTFTTLMGDEVEPRREFIHKYAREVRNLDV